MVRAELVLEGGLLKSCRVSGHAGAGPKGGDIVCAAVSVLLRTAFKVLSDRKDIVIRGGAPERGEFRLETALAAQNAPDRVNDTAQGTAPGACFLAGVGAFLIEGLLSVSGEYPDFCQVTIERRN